MVFLFWYNHIMIEARALVPELDSARAIVNVLKAEYKGHYRIHDTIYRNKITRSSLSDEFLRLRHMPENIWQEKPVILAIKKTSLHNIGKESDVPVKLQFDTTEEARNYYDLNLSGTYEEDFEFWREGWQYFLPNGDVVDLEIVENKFPTIELKSETDDGITSLIKKFKLTSDQIIIGPSVVTVRKLIKSS
ncbi:MAG: hypothetical protein JWN75_643 [Candidatus Saccharibacteria bacterium]|nr:hypothetical protein [Candidatus Saccharibacteria bacterium]